MMEPPNPCPVRKTVFVVEETLRESSALLPAPARRVAAIAVLQNPCAGTATENLALLAGAATALGEKLMPKLTALLEAPVLAYGKAAIVGTSGKAEHAAALLHPTLGKPIRSAIGGGAAVIPSTAKMGALGTLIDVPLGHRDSAWSFDEIDTMTLGLADAPLPDEIVLIIVVASAGRPNARISALANKVKS
jgi:amino acid synthesis protein